MATDVAVPSHPLEAGDSLSTEKVTYKGFAKLDAKGDIEQIVAKAESTNQSSWKKLEASGATQWNENEFIRYTVKTDAGFSLLVPDEAQRLYIIQAGLNYVQNSKANAYMVEPQENNAASPKYNGETIDLRESINEPPSKRALTDQQKMERLIKSMGLSNDETAALFADLAKRFAAQAAASAPQISAGEDETAVEA